MKMIPIIQKIAKCDLNLSSIQTVTTSYSTLVCMIGPENNFNSYISPAL